MNIWSTTQPSPAQFHDTSHHITPRHTSTAPHQYRADNIRIPPASVLLVAAKLRLVKAGSGRGGAHPPRACMQHRNQLRMEPGGQVASCKLAHAHPFLKAGQAAKLLICDARLHAFPLSLSPSLSHANSTYASPDSRLPDPGPVLDCHSGSKSSRALTLPCAPPASSPAELPGALHRRTGGARPSHPDAPARVRPVPNSKREQQPPPMPIHTYARHRRPRRPSRSWRCIMTVIQVRRRDHCESRTTTTTAPAALVRLSAHRQKKKHSISQHRPLTWVLCSAPAIPVRLLALRVRMRRVASRRLARRVAAAIIGRRRRRGSAHRKPSFRARLQKTKQNMSCPALPCPALPCPHRSNPFLPHSTSSSAPLPLLRRLLLDPPPFLLLLPLSAPSYPQKSDRAMSSHTRPARPIDRSPDHLIDQPRPRCWGSHTNLTNRCTVLLDTCASQTPTTSSRSDPTRSDPTRPDPTRPDPIRSDPIYSRPRCYSKPPCASLPPPPRLSVRSQPRWRRRRRAVHAGPRPRRRQGRRA